MVGASAPHWTMPRQPALGPQLWARLLQLDGFGELWIGRMGFRFFISLREEDDSGVRRAEVGERSVGPLGAFTHAKKWQTLREPVMPTDKAVAV